MKQPIEIKEPNPIADNLLTRQLLEECTKEERAKLEELAKAQKAQRDMLELGIKREKKNV